MQIRNVPVIDSNQSKRPSTILMRKTKQRCRRRKFLPGDENLKASAKISIFSGSISSFNDSVWTEQQRQKISLSCEKKRKNTFNLPLS